MNGFLTRAGSPPRGYRFAGFRLEPEGTLLRGETPIELPSDELAALRLLLDRAGEVVSPMELRRALWGDEQVAEDSVASCITSLRVRLHPEDCIEELYRRGYRVTVPVKVDSLPAPDALPRLAIVPFNADLGAPEDLALTVTEQLMERLSDPHGAVALVLARDSVFALAQRGLGAREIGEALHADFVLKGIVRASQGLYRVRAEMIRVEDSAELWVEDLLVDYGSLVGSASEVVRRVTARLRDFGTTGSLPVPGDVD